MTEAERILAEARDVAIAKAEAHAKAERMAAAFADRSEVEEDTDCETPDFFLAYRDNNLAAVCRTREEAVLWVKLYSTASDRYLWWISGDTWDVPS